MQKCYSIEWLDCGKLDGGFEILNDDEIVSSVASAQEEDEIDNDEEPDIIENTKTSHSEAESMLSKCIDWFETQEEVLLLRKIRNIAAQKARASKKQRKMTDYFQV